jgi:hypothetical protein
VELSHSSNWSSALLVKVTGMLQFTSPSVAQSWFELLDNIGSTGTLEMNGDKVGNVEVGVRLEEAFTECPP